MLKRLFGNGKKEDHPLIAVIEDEEDLCKLIRLALEPHGYTVAVAHDGLAGLELIRAQRPALIVLDIKMPNMNGYQMLARMQQDPELAGIPVVMLSSVTGEVSEKSDEEWAKSLKVCQYISKPCDPIQVVEAVNSQLARAVSANQSTTPVE